MPTAAKLVAALCFAVLGYFFAEYTIPRFANGTAPGFFLPLCVVSGALSGWFLCGAAANGMGSGIGTGITAAIGLAFSSLFVLSFVEMIEKSLRKHYDGPMNGIVDVFAMMAEFAQRFATPELGLLLAGGGILCGAVTGYFGKRYPH